jgi:magnesium transporter
MLLSACGPMAPSLARVAFVQQYSFSAMGQGRGFALFGQTSHLCSLTMWKPTQLVIRRRPVEAPSASMGTSSDIQSSMPLECAPAALFLEFAARFSDPGDPAAVAAGAADVLPPAVRELSSATAVAIPANALVLDSVAYVRSIRPDHDRVYVVDPRSSALLGHVLLGDLLLAGERCDVRVDALLRVNAIVLRPHDRINYVAAAFAASGEAAAPVVASDGTLLGIVRASDAARLAAGAGSAPYFATRATSLFSARAPWLVALLVLQSASSIILGRFSDLLQQNVLLTFFLTTIVGAAGNSGSQSAAMLIVGLARGEVDAKRDFWRVLGREFLVAIALGLLLSAIAFLRVLVLGGGAMDRELLLSSSCTIAVALLLTVVFASLVGSATPMIFKRLGIDPALGAGPALATITDISGVLLLCFTAAILLQTS